MIDVTPRRTDMSFRGSPDAGPQCLCSRCRRPILDAPVIRVVGGDREWRYHPTCVGLTGDVEVTP